MMLTYQVKGLLQEVLARVGTGHDFVAAVRIAQKVFDEISDGVVGIATNTNNPGYANNVFSTFTSLSGNISDASPRKVYTALESIESTLEDFQRHLDARSAYVDDLLVNLNEFAGLYDNYLTKPTPVNAAPLVLAAPRILQRIYDFEAALVLLDKVLEEPLDEIDEGGVMSILLPNTVELSDFIARLAAIQSMYSELCQLLDISQMDHPLRIAKIESGSLWAKVAGSAVVLTLMSQFIQSSATFLFHKYTTEGQIASIPAKVESLDKVVDLRKKLHAAGLSTSDMDAHLAKSAHAIASDLNTLLDRQPSITLNGQEISVAEQEAKQRISARRIPKLSSNLDE